MSHTSDISFHEGYVIKRVHRYLEHGVVQREIEWLERMHEEGRTPNLLDHHGNTLKISYVGEPLCRANAPDDLKSQLKDMALMLKRHKCAHHDINPGNLMVNNGWLSLIDFQWALPMSQNIPDTWPKDLNSKFRVAPEKHDDAHSIQQVLKAMGSRPGKRKNHVWNSIGALFRTPAK